MPILTKEGVAKNSPIKFSSLDSFEADKTSALELSNDSSPEAVVDYFEQLDMIRIPFPSFADGRGFTLARSLRDLGYTGRLRAQGHVLSDQFSFAIDSGFDEVEIDDELARRQPVTHWTYRSRPTYRNKLATPLPPKFPIPDGVFAQTVTEVEHYTDRLFRFRVTRPASFRFRSGEFVMIGLPNAERPVFRAYSIASPAWDDTLEFYSIKVPDGPLTQHLQNIRPGDTLLLKKKATGTLVHDALLSGKRLWLFSTGTGIAPFVSLIRDPETYEKFDHVYLVHTCRDAAELNYGYNSVELAKNDPLVGEAAQTQLTHLATTTRQESPVMGRITTLIETNKLFDHLNVDGFGPTDDRIMICGSMDMLKDLKDICEARGFTEGNNRQAAQFAVERAFVG